MPDHHEADPGAPAAVADTATRFLAAWLTPGDPASRAAALAPVAAPTLVDALAAVPADNLPAATPGPVTVGDVSDLAATCTSTLSNGTTVHVELVHTGAGWRVSRVGR